MGRATAHLAPIDAGRAAIASVRELVQDIGLTGRLADLGVHAELIPRLSENALRDACMATNPRPASAADIARLFHAAL